MKNTQRIGKSNRLLFIILSLLALSVYAISNRYVVCGPDNKWIFDNWTQTMQYVTDFRKVYIRRDISHYYHYNKSCVMVKDNPVGIKLGKAKAKGCEPCPQCTK